MDNLPTPPKPNEMDSSNVEVLVLDGVEDTTVRPMREPFRSLAIKKYGLPTAPTPPSEENRCQQPNPS